MAEVRIAFNGTQNRLDRLFTGFAKAHGWSEQVLVDGVLVANPISFLNYGKDVIKLQIKEDAARQRAAAASEAANLTAVAENTDDATNITVTAT